MMAAICGAHATGPTTILGAECVEKSYPAFFEDFRALGGIARPPPPRAPPRKRVSYAFHLWKRP